MFPYIIFRPPHRCL